MANDIINYQRGQRTVGGKQVKTSQVTNPTNISLQDLLSNILTSEGYQAPGFASNVDENLTYYDPETGTLVTQPAAPRADDTTGNGGNSSGRQADQADSAAGAGSTDAAGFAKSVAAAPTGPFGAMRAIGQLALTGTGYGLGDDINNTNQNPAYSGDLNNKINELKAKYPGMPIGTLTKLAVASITTQPMKQPMAGDTGLNDQQANAVGQQAGALSDTDAQAAADAINAGRGTNQSGTGTAAQGRAIGSLAGQDVDTSGLGSKGGGGLTGAQGRSVGSLAGSGLGDAGLGGGRGNGGNNDGGRGNGAGGSTGPGSSSRGDPRGSEGLGGNNSPRGGDGGNGGGGGSSGGDGGHAGHDSGPGAARRTGGYVMSRVQPSSQPMPAGRSMQNDAQGGFVRQPATPMSNIRSQVMSNMPLSSARRFAAGGFVPSAGYAAGGTVMNQPGAAGAANLPGDAPTPPPAAMSGSPITNGGGGSGAAAMPLPPAQPSPAPNGPGLPAGQSPDMYQAGGRFNPTPGQIADDGVTDDQPINADEGEYVINKQSAQVLGPDVLNLVNDPNMAPFLQELFQAIFGLTGGGGMADQGNASMGPGANAPASLSMIGG